MNVLCDDMEEIAFRDGEQRRAKPSRTRLIDLVRVMLPLMRTDSFECFLRQAGLRTFLDSAEASPSQLCFVSAFTDRCASNSVI